MKIRPVGAEIFRTDRRTDMMQLTVTLHNYANAPETSALRHQLTLQASALYRKYEEELSLSLRTTSLRRMGGTGGVVNL